MPRNTFFQHLETSFSFVGEYVKNAKVPFPILACAHVRDFLPMSEFWDEVEMSPFEVSLPGYGINIPTQKFNSVWGNGILQRRLPEPPLHFLMAASGSAFAITWSRLMDKSEIGSDLSNYIDSLQSHHQEGDRDSSSDSDEDECDPLPTGRRLSTRATKNFASKDDEWLDELQRKESARGVVDVPDEGMSERGFLMKRTAKVRNCSKAFQGISKFRLNTSQLEEAPKEHVEKMSTKAKNISLCDAALGCNLPSIHVLRPQRTVDILIVVDCSNYFEKDRLIMELFATVAKQIYDHGIKFPVISLEKIAVDPFRECYVFEDESDPECPIVLWFTLANTNFQNLENPHRRPGYPTPDAADEGKEKFNDFNIFPESSDFGTLRLSFSALNFDRLRELTRFNIMSNIWIVKEKIARKVKQMRDRNAA